MGLTIHYSLKARGNQSAARKFVTALHQCAQDLPFKELGKVLDLSGESCDFEKRDRDDPLRWALIQAEGSVELKATHRTASGQLGDTLLRVKPARLLTFTTWPGEGCEEANFGLCQYPATLHSPGLGTVKTGLSGSWSWRSFCKTQYASNPNCGGVANFLRCHLAVIALLDKAKELGALAEVHDEGKFWEKREMPALVGQIGNWNQWLAAFHGQLQDTVGDGFQSEISAFPNFEQLEAAGQNRLPPEVAILGKLIRQVVKQQRAPSP